MRRFRRLTDQHRTGTHKRRLGLLLAFKAGFVFVVPLAMVLLTLAPLWIDRARLRMMLRRGELTPC